MRPKPVGPIGSPSREAIPSRRGRWKAGDVVTVRKTIVTYTYRVLAPVSSRVGAKLVSEYAEDLTPQSERDKLNIPKETIFIQRDRGTGRPTKRERRQIDTLMEEFYDAEEDMDE